MQGTILGRQPALFIALVVAAVHLIGTLGFDFFQMENAGALVATIDAAAAAITAWTVRPIVPAAFLGLISAVLALVGTYGINLPGETVAGINAAVYPLLAFLTWGNVSPIPTPVSSGGTKNPTPEAAAKTFGEAAVEEGPAAVQPLGEEPPPQG